MLHTLDQPSLKIIVLGTRGFPGVAGGIERHCESLYPELCKIGCRVQVLARRWLFSPEDRRPSYEEVGLIYLATPRASPVETIVHTASGVIFAAVSRPDILHFHGVGPALLIPLARLLGLKVVFTHHGPDYRRRQWGRLAKWVLRLGERLGTRYAHQVIAVSEEIERGVCRRRASGCVRIPNGVGQRSPRASTNYLREIGIEPGEYVLSVGRFVEDKGFHDLVEAFAAVSPPGVRLVLVGGSYHPSRYSRRLEAMAEKHDVILTGLLSGETLWEVFSKARLFVLPSYYEGLPITLLEAMSFGIDVLVSDIEPNLELGLAPGDYFPVVMLTSWQPC